MTAVITGTTVIRRIGAVGRNGGIGSEAAGTGNLFIFYFFSSQLVNDP